MFSHLKGMLRGTELSPTELPLSLLGISGNATLSPRQLADEQDLLKRTALVCTADWLEERWATALTKLQWGQWSPDHGALSCVQASSKCPHLICHQLVSGSSPSNPHPLPTMQFYHRPPNPYVSKYKDMRKRVYFQFVTYVAWPLAVSTNHLEWLLASIQRCCPPPTHTNTVQMLLIWSSPPPHLLQFEL